MVYVYFSVAASSKNTDDKTEHSGKPKSEKKNNKKNNANEVVVPSYGALNS